MTTDNQSLPPLPYRYSDVYEGTSKFEVWVESQMRDYGAACADHARKVALREAKKCITAIAIRHECTPNTQAEQAADECLTAIEGLMK